MNDVYEGKPGRSRGGTILAEATHTKSKHLRRFAEDISWDEAVALFRGCKLFCSRWEKCRNSPRTGGVKQQVIMVSPPGQQALRMCPSVYQPFFKPELAAID
ncbi:hypothetical protein PCH_Pc21g10050 [Penicillium rubens Wisconsin 54-1255]|uniref:Uncharacterized protein n=1 Tax=Penicillium rubens (strain ATCC 28089 / DSM 1075 / NRRL 1951 / Wisconsin 54-1255) TaxID=500485 RepID=B6HI23_PENRW|nr:hypothetical protein PCH_Pc21g10050 [Penicillium rubens Wisconsin 54-1255]